MPRVAKDIMGIGSVFPHGLSGIYSMPQGAIDFIFLEPFVLERIEAQCVAHTLAEPLSSQ